MIEVGTKVRVRNLNVEGVVSEIFRGRSDWAYVDFENDSGHVIANVRYRFQELEEL